MGTKRLLLVVSLAALLAATLFAAGDGETADTPAEDSVVVVDGEYNEAPMLRGRVEAGELPPVDERLPSDPAVVVPLIEVGTYGGVIQVASTNRTEWGDLQAGMNGAQGILAIDSDGEIYPELVSRYDISDDSSTFTFHLRRGIRWSDGEPFTSDDIMFAVEDKLLNTDLFPTPPGYLTAGGDVAEVTAPDEYTVRFEFAVPNPRFIIEMTTFVAWQEHLLEPKHYLSNWHIDYNEDADELAASEGFGTWTEAFNWHRTGYSGQNDLELPRLEPFIVVESSPTRKVYERNPYYYKVDTEGNQLPYLDGIEVSIVSNIEVHDLRVMNGQVDFAIQRLSLQNFPIYRRNETSAGYRVELVPGNNMNVIVPNQNYKDERYRELFSDVRFRQALSLSIDRDSINQALYFGRGASIQATAAQAPFAKEEWQTHFAEHDPDRAGDLLEQMGFSRKNRDGIYLMSDGSALTLVLEYVDSVTSTAELELVKAQLESVGIGVALRNQPTELIFDRLQAIDEIMVRVDVFPLSDINPYGNPSMLALNDFGIGWAEWIEGNRTQGIEPPDDVKEFYRLVDEEWGETIYGSEEYSDIGRQIYDEWKNFLYVIGIVGASPQPLVVRENLGNVLVPDYPRVNAKQHFTWFRDQFFFK